MFSNGSVISLINNKSHGEGESAMTLASNTCGMVVQLHKRAVDSNHEYVVDFGPYGQWYCYHNELSGQQTVQEEGYDRDDQPPSLVARLLESDFVGMDDHNNDQRPSPKIDFEADLKKRMKEIENGTAS